MVSKMHAFCSLSELTLRQVGRYPRRKVVVQKTTSTLSADCSLCPATICYSLAVDDLFPRLRAQKGPHVLVGLLLQLISNTNI